MRHGLETCTALGHRRVIVLGHPAYYRRFGFRPARNGFGIEPPGPWPDETFQALALIPGSLDDVAGRACYSQPFQDLEG